MEASPTAARLHAEHVARRRRFFPAGFGKAYSPPAIVAIRERASHPNTPRLQPNIVMVAKYPTGRIVSAVAQAHGISVEKLHSKGRSIAQDMARPHAVATLIMLRPDLSSAQIATAIGRRDHTTILHHQYRWPEVAPYCVAQIARVTEILDSEHPENIFPGENLRSTVD